MSERIEHGFRTGAIECVAGYEHERGSGVLIRVGDAEIWVQATRAGRKAYVGIRASGKTSVSVDRGPLPVLLAYLAGVGA